MKLGHEAGQPGEALVTRSPGLDAFPSELLGAVAAHELREPLHAIQSFLSILLHERAGPLTPLQADFLATARRAGQRLERQIDDVMVALSTGQGLQLEPALI
ncbi:MAG: histidine kinase dimerization/phospho-acceptor domain-containing protein, partial [Geminicoccales bacterium]